ncbi:MAG: YSC84-related protein [Massilia sp.]
MLTLLGLLAWPMARADRPPAGQASPLAPAKREEMAAARHVQEAAGVVGRMVAEPRMRDLLQQARGIFIVPRYGRAAMLGVGAAGGAGVLLIKQKAGVWGGPAFYDLGSVSAGAQGGGEEGAIALVLINETAVNRFTQKTAFALTAGAGITLVDWSRRRQGAVGDGDVVIWSAARGLYATLLAVGVSGIHYNDSLTRAYYHQQINLPDAVAGRYVNRQSDALRQALAASSPGPPPGDKPSR